MIGLLRGLVFMGMWGLLTAVAAHGQPPYIIQHYTNENGLPANGIKGIELDTTTGFLWVGTQAGLVRFDGKHFMHFGSAKNTSIPARISFIGKNREGTIYCEEDNFSVYRIVRNEAEWVVTDSFLIAPFTQIEGSDPVLPLKVMTEKLRHAQPSAFLPPWIVFHDEPRDSSSYSFLYFDHIYYYDAPADTLLGYPGFQNVLKVGSRVYYARPNLEVWTYDKQLKKLMPVPVAGMPGWKEKGQERPRFIWKPGMKAPLLIYKRNIWELQQTGDTLYLQPLCGECSPDDAYIYNAQVWKERNIIFLGSEKNGLYVVRTPFLRTIRSDTLIEAGRAEYAQAEITPGMITTGYGVSFSTQNKLSYRKGGIEFHPWAIYRDKYGDHWFHARDTIIHLHRKDGHYTKMAIGSGINKMVFGETKDRLYVITDAVIAEITGDRYRQLYKLPYSPHALKNTLNPDDVIEWKPGVLAIATEKLVLYNTEKGGTPDTIPIPGLTTKVRTLRKYGDYLFIGTYGQGFYVYKNGVVKKMPLDKNKYLAYAHCFVPDEQGYCWISTNHGLFKASLEALTAAYEHNLDEIYYHYFGRDDGLYNTELNGGCQPCALKLSSGLFSFPTMNGVAVLDARRPHVPPPAGQLFIEEIAADSGSFQPGDSILQALPYHLRNIRFRLALPQFGNPENIYFSYKLEPYNEEWETHDILQNNILQFGGLTPGSYTLYLRVRNGFEPDQCGTTVIRFRILKPWHQAWWFYGLCVLGFIAVTGGLVKWRTARIAKRKEELQELVTLQTKNLEEDNKIKARLIGIISHDMISPLKFMGYMSKKLRDTYPESDAGYHTASFIANVAGELESLSVNILNWIKFHHQSIKMKPEKFDLHGLITKSVEIPATLAKEKGLSFQTDVPEHTEMVQYRQAMSVIVYNLSMNATKYTSRGGIIIKSESTGEGVILTVTDTGHGMPPALVKKLNSTESFVAGYAIGETSKYQFGYIIIKDLLRLVEGSMKVESVENKGTTVTLQFRRMVDGNNTAHD